MAVPVSVENAVEPGVDTIAHVLGRALAGWSEDRDPGRLRRALLTVLLTLDELS